MSSNKTAIKKIEVLAVKYILVDTLLFKIVTNPDKEATVLAIPKACTDKIITLYHSSLFMGHQGVIKMYLTINDKILYTKFDTLFMFLYKRLSCMPNLHNEKPPTRWLQTRINLNYRPLSRLSMDLKVMPRSNKGHKYILCIIDEVTNYLITVPIYQFKAEEIGDVLKEHVITKYCIPDCIIMDQESAFMSSLINYLFSKLDIKKLLLLTIISHYRPNMELNHCWLF